jgi:hypothetical protein
MAAPAPVLAPVVQGPVPVPVPVPVALAHKRILNIQLIPFPNAAIMIDELQYSDVLDEKNPHLNFLESGNDKWLLTAVKHTANCPANKRGRAPIQRIVIDAEFCMLRIPIPDVYDRANMVYNVKNAYISLDTMRAWWDAFAEKFVRENTDAMKNIPTETAVQIIKDMLVIHVERGRSYIEFAVFTVQT